MPFFNSESRPKLSEGQSLREYAHDEEVKNGKNIADAAASVDSLTHFIWSALPSPKKASNGKYSDIYDFDSKGVITDHIRDKQPDLAEMMSVIYVFLYI